MDSERWRRLRAEYDRVLDAPERDRARLLEEFRRVEPELAVELAKLLAADANPSDVLDTPVIRLAVVDLEPGVVLCGRFRLLRRIGHGGMGDVWAARDQKLNEDVAVKTIRADLAQDRQQLARLKRELLLARRVSHPSVCKVFDLYDHVSDAHTLSFLTMELIEGETLGERLAREKTLPFGDAVRIVRDIADGLAAAHAVGVVHRDLKPANIMLTTGEGGRRIVILDFGLARDPGRVESDGATVFGTLVGTPEYMAPEQISGAAVTPSTDLYALGLMFFEMLDGTRPFAGVSTADSWMRRAREGPKPLSGSVDGVRARTDAVIRKCLAYEPGERYQSAAELVGALSSTRLSLVLPDDRRVWLAAAALVLAVLGAGGFAAWRRFTPQLPPAEALEWFEESQQALAEGASVRALNDINRAIEIAPRFAPFHAGLAEIRLELDMPSAAQESMLRANELAAANGRYPEEFEAHMRGLQALLQHRCDDAVRAVSQRIETTSIDVRAYRMVAAARIMERCERTKDAEQLLIDAGRIDPRNAAVPLRLARLVSRRREFDSAMRSLDVAEKLFRDRNNSEGLAEVFAIRGVLQTEQDSLDAAFGSIQKAADLAQGLQDVRQQIQVRLARAVALRKLGDVVAAGALTEEAIALGRRANLEALTLDGLFMAANVHLVRNQFGEAQTLLERASAIAAAYRHDESIARAQLSLASLFIRVVKPDEALAALDAARPFYERVGHRRNLWLIDTLTADVAIMRADFAKAIAVSRGLLAAIETDQNDPEQKAATIENLATALMAVGNYPEALNAYERALDLRIRAKRRRAVFYGQLNVSEALASMGRFADADRYLNAADTASTEFPELASQVLRVRAANALRQGRYAVAKASAHELLAKWSEVSVERRLRASLILCAAELRVRAFDKAQQICDGARHEAARTGQKEIFREASLLSAELSIRLGVPEAAVRFADNAGGVLPDTPNPERWRHLALSVAARRIRGDSDVLDLQRRMSREADGLRLTWGEHTYETWLGLADVSELNRLASSAL